MARKPPSKPGKPSSVKVQLSLDETTAKRLRLVAAELGLDQSEVVTRLINANYSGVHLRGLNQQNEPAPSEGQGSGSQPPTVRINTPLNRISEIHSRAAAPVDRAIDTIADID